jgi:hypothetical protein
MGKGVPLHAVPTRLASFLQKHVLSRGRTRPRSSGNATRLQCIYLICANKRVNSRRARTPATRRR